MIKLKQHPHKSPVGAKGYNKHSVSKYMSNRKWRSDGVKSAHHYTTTWKKLIFSKLRKNAITAGVLLLSSLKRSEPCKPHQANASYSWILKISYWTSVPTVSIILLIILAKIVVFFAVTGSLCLAATADYDILNYLVDWDHYLGQRNSFIVLRRRLRHKTTYLLLDFFGNRMLQRTLL